MSNPNPWQAGDFGRIASNSVAISEALADAIPIYAGQHVLDIGCGTGNTAMAAARRRAFVTAADPVPALLGQMEARAAVEQLAITPVEAGAESLPLPDASFDLALSTFGLIFSESPAACIAEAARLLRPQGRLVLTAWATNSLNDRLFATCLHFAPNLAMLHSARRWGNPESALPWLTPHFPAVRFEKRSFLTRALSPEKWLAGARQFLAPVTLAYAANPPERHPEMDQTFLALLDGVPPAPNGTLLLDIPFWAIYCDRM